MSSVILDPNDRALLLSNNAPPSGKRAASYAVYSTIALGKNGSRYVLQNFRMQYDLLNHVFDDVQYNTLGIETANSDLLSFIVPPTPSPTPKAASRSANARAVTIRRKTGSRAFMGRRFRFKVPAVKGALLDRSGFRKDKSRTAASMLFPYMATNHQVAAWLSTHQTVGGTNVGSIVSEKGSQVLMMKFATAAEHDQEIGSFDLATKARLKSRPVLELDPA